MVVLCKESLFCCFSNNYNDLRVIGPDRTNATAAWIGQLWWCQQVPDQNNSGGMEEHQDVLIQESPSSSVP